MIRLTSYFVVAVGLAAAACSGGGSDEDDPVEGCAAVAGTWTVSGCGGDDCEISQNVCAASLACDGGASSYSGTVSGNHVTFGGRNVAIGVDWTCSASIAGNSMTGSCTAPGFPTCSFSASRAR